MFYLFANILQQRKILLILSIRSVHVPDTKFPQEKYAGNTKGEDPHIERTLRITHIIWSSVEHFRSEIQPIRAEYLDDLDQ